MKKAMLIGLGAFMLLTGCQAEEGRQPKNEAKAESKIEVKDLNGVFDLFAKEGLKAESRDKMFFSMVGAIDGDSFLLDGQKVEVYQYKSAKELKANSEALINQVAGSGEVIQNGEFLMVVYNDVVAAKEKLIEAFKSFK